MQAAADEHCCRCGEEDAAAEAEAAETRRGMALDRLQALLGIEGDYYDSSCNAAGTPPPMLTVANGRRGPRRRSARPVGSAGGASGDGVFYGGNNTYGGLRGGARGRARFSGEGGAAFGGNTPTLRYLATFSESRGRVCSWAYGVVDYFGLPRGIVGWMMYYMDRVLSSQRSSLGSVDDDATTTTNDDFLLLSVAAFYLAMKLVGGGSHGGGSASSFDGHGWGGHQQHPRQLSMSVMLELSKHRFTSRQISEAEFGILQALNWRVHPPTPDQYVFDLVDLCCGCGSSASASASATTTTTREDVFDCTIYLIELSVVNHYFLGFKPSEIVVAAMHNARNLTMRTRSGDGDSDGGSDDSGDDADEDCVILPARTPAVFRVEPMQVLPGIDPLRVAWCRFRLSEMIDQQQARKQPHQAATNRSSAPPNQEEEAAVLRTCSPVSVHPRDPKNAVHADPGDAGGLAEPCGKTGGEVRSSWS